MTEVSIQETAGRLGRSVDTVRRRLKSGALAGQRDRWAKWRIALPDDAPPAKPDVVPELRARIAELLAQAAERDRRESELRQALARATGTRMRCWHCGIAAGTR